tara:strand:- start:8989 stop:9669 length:681 start_codon:yes stop_codon:yes gene_type:complete
VKRFLIFFLIISCSPLKKYDGTGEKWKSSIDKLTELNITQIKDDDAILFIGSSSIRMWKSIEQDIRPYKSIRRGYGGARYTDLIHFTEQLVEPHNVKAVAIFVANDITGTKNDLKPKEVLRLVKYIVKSIRKNHINKPIFFIETTPTSSRWKVWNQISYANDLISDFCSNNESLFFISTREFFIASNGKPIDDYFVSDRLHLNEKGYSVWGEIIRASFDKNLNTKI